MTQEDSLFRHTLCGSILCLGMLLSIQYRALGSIVWNLQPFFHVYSYAAAMLQLSLLLF